MDLSIIVLAAGAGKRMNSKRPKVLHLLGGVPLLVRVARVARALHPQRLCILHSPHNGASLQAALTAIPDVCWAEQAHPQGTAHAVQCALSALGGQASGGILVLFGDVPLISQETLERVLVSAQAQPQGLHFVSVRVADPCGFGRVLRNERGEVIRIVEERDASPAEKQIGEINTGILWASVSFLERYLPQVQNKNAQHEFYLTDLFQLAHQADLPIVAIPAKNPLEVLGVNDRLQLAQLERAYQRQLAEHWLLAGIHMADPARVDFRGTVVFEGEASIDINVIFEGEVRIGEGVSIGPHCVIKNSILGAGVRLEAFSHCEGAQVGPACVVGPYARLRPGTVLGQSVCVGNFVEIKKTTMGEHAKANHLTYLGDAQIGAFVNIGAGTITCNYDGAHKHTTHIEAGAFIGSNTALVAPVQVGAGATIGAGTTLTKNAPAGQLTLTRVPQKTVAHWRRPEKQDSEE